MASSDPGWLQGVFRTLVVLFDLVGLKKNIRKMFIIVFHLCQRAGTQSEAAYKRRMTGAEPSYHERQQVRV